MRLQACTRTKALPFGFLVVFHNACALAGTVSGFLGTRVMHRVEPAPQAPFRSGYTCLLTFHADAGAVPSGEEPQNCL
jgi:hypothetical protein